MDHAALGTIEQRMNARLAIFDIDGTLRRVADPWLHLHRHLNTAAEGGLFFRQWQQGEISYEELCRRDAAMWRDVPRSRILDALDSNPLRAGARDLVQWLANRQVVCVGLSTGLSVFHDVTAQSLGLAEVVCNELLFDGDRCTGEVAIRVTEDGKAAAMDEILARHGCRAAQTMVFGDGPADIPLLRRAGVAVAVFPREAEVANCADYVLHREPLSDFVAVLDAISKR